LVNARAFYTPAGSIEIQAHFFTALRTKIENRDMWSRYCTKPVKEIEVTGDHFSIFRPPEVEEFTKLFRIEMDEKL
jgi:hypothetical protein